MGPNMTWMDLRGLWTPFWGSEICEVPKCSNFEPKNWKNESIFPQKSMKFGFKMVKNGLEMVETVSGMHLEGQFEGLKPVWGLWGPKMFKFWTKELEKRERFSTEKHEIWLGKVKTSPFLALWRSKVDPLGYLEGPDLVWRPFGGPNLTKKVKKRTKWQFRTWKKTWNLTGKVEKRPFFALKCSKMTWIQSRVPLLSL